MSTVRCIGKHLILEVIHKNITYECMVSCDCKDLYECSPETTNWIEIENLIRNAAWNLQIKDLNEKG